MHPPTFPPSPLPTLSFSPLSTFSHLTFPLSPFLTFPSLLPFAFKSFSDRIFFINFEAKFVTTEKYE